MMTGTPAAMASTTDTPKLSEYDGRKKTSASAKAACFIEPLRKSRPQHRGAERQPVGLPLQPSDECRIAISGYHQNGLGWANRT